MDRSSEEAIAPMTAPTNSFCRSGLAENIVWLRVFSPGSTLSVTCRSRNRPRMSSQVSRCLPRLARQLRLGPLSQCSGCVSASHPQHVLSKQGQFPAGWCSCSAALRPYPAVGGGAMVFRCGRRRLRLSTRAGRPAWAVRVRLIYWLWQYLLLSLDRYFDFTYAST